MSSRHRGVYEKLNTIKTLLKELHKGGNVDDVKEKLSKILVNISPWEIGFIEQELVREGISPLEIALMCDAHVSVFRDKIVEDKELLNLPEGHPLHTLLLESREALSDAEKLSIYANALKYSDKHIQQKYLQELRRKAIELLGLKKHFTRLQMLVFPYIERKGLTAIPRVLWTKQDQLIQKIKQLVKTATMASSKDLLEKVVKLAQTVSKEVIDMVFRETRILYPTLRVMLTEGEWAGVKNEEEVIGFYKVEPRGKWKPREKPVLPHEITSKNIDYLLEKLPSPVKKMVSSINKSISRDDYVLIRENDMKLSEGYLSIEEINAILNTLPFEISFVDKNDRLRFYNAGKHRVFIRTKTVLGRPVEYCHPPKSVYLVRRIIDDFKNNKRDKAEFWINMNGRLIYIRYFPVRDVEGNYLGTLEVVQDITDIKKIEGEKRLLD